MSISGIQGQLLEVTIVGCHKLKDTEWISRQDPYVCLEYASTKFRTRTCTDGGKNPIFQEKFVFNLIEGLREIEVAVWNSNTLTYDDFIGSGKVQLQDVLTRGFDDRAWPLQTKTGRYAGEVKLILHYANANKATSFTPSAPPYLASPQPQVSMYAPPPPLASGFPMKSTSGYPPPPPSTTYPTAATTNPPPHTAYPYLPTTAAYSPYPYPPAPDHAAYPPVPYQPPPPAAYPPQPYPPPPHVPPYSYSGHYPSTYPPPPH